MLTDLQSSVSTISPEALDKLFSETPDNQVTAEDLNIPAGETKKEPQIVPKSPLDVPLIDLDKLEELEEKEEIKEEEKDKKPLEVTDKQEVKTEDKKKKPEAKKETEAELLSRNEFLKNSVNYLVEKGIFKDFEGREELELNEEVYAKLLEKQVEKQVEDLYSSKKKSAGEFGEAVLEFIENGGEADKLIDLFKERKTVQEFDITDETSQTDLVAKWYKEVHGWKSDKIKKYLDTLNSEEGALEAEAEEVKSKYEQTYNEKLAAIKEEQSEYNKAQIQKQKAFETNITKVIDSNKEFDSKRKQFIKNSIFKFKTLEDGSKVNDFYIKFAEWQNNPEKYIELAEFVLDQEGYIKRKSIDIENKVTEKTFNFVKGNSALNKNKGSNHVEKEENRDSGTDFSIMFK